MEFRYIILELRKERGYNQTELAEILNVAKSSVAMWETGKRIPQRTTMENIADLFNVDMDYLYGKSDVRKQVSFDDKGNTYVSVPEYSPDMIEVIALYGKLKKEQKEIILNLLRTFNS